MRLNIIPGEKQIQGASFLVTRPEPHSGGFLCYTTGSGKTVIQILALFKQVLDGKAEKTIIFCTKSSLIEVLGDYEARTNVQPYVIEDMAGLEHFIRAGNLKFGLMQYNRFANLVAQGPVDDDDSDDDSEHKRVATPIDQGKLHHLWTLLSSRKLAVSLDECHSIKSPTSFIGRVFRKVRGSFKYCYGATATAIMSDIYDMYHIVNFYNPGLLGSLDSFSEEFLVRRKKTIYAGGRRMVIYEVLSYKNLDRLQALLAQVCVSYFPKYDIDFAEKIGDLEDIALYEKAAKGVFSKGVLKSGEKKKHAQRLVDLQYVVNKDPGKKRLLLDCLKETIGAGVIIFCSYYESVSVVEEVLRNCRIEFKEISGRVEDRKTVKEWFIKNPTNKVLIITRAGGQSMNLQATPNMILFDIPFGIGYMLQIMGRVCREYSDHKKFRILIPILRGTIDEYKFNLISSNREVLMRLFRNELVPPSEQVASFNQEVLDQLKKDLLWRIGRKKQ